MEYCTLISSSSSAHVYICSKVFSNNLKILKPTFFVIWIIRGILFYDKFIESTLMLCFPIEKVLKGVFAVFWRYDISTIELKNFAFQTFSEKLKCCTCSLFCILDQNPVGWEVKEEYLYWLAFLWTGFILETLKRAGLICSMILFYWIFFLLILKTLHKTFFAKYSYPRNF